MTDALDTALDAFMQSFDGDLKANLANAMKAFSAASWLSAKDITKEDGKTYLAACVNRFGDFSGYYVVQYSKAMKAYTVSNGRALMPLEARPVRFLELAAGFNLPGAEVTTLSIGV